MVKVLFLLIKLFKILLLILIVFGMDLLVNVEVFIIFDLLIIWLFNGIFLFGFINICCLILIVFGVIVFICLFIKRFVEFGWIFINLVIDFLDWLIVVFWNYLLIW